MNLKIVTFLRAQNYGAFLQAYALNDYLSQKHNVEFLDYRVEKIEDAYKPFNIKKASLKSILRYMRYFVPLNLKYSRFKKCINSVNKTCSIYNENDIEKIKDTTDIYITGSDQVWNPNIVGCLSDVYTLNFDAKNAKKIAYAASVGNVDDIDAHIDDYKRKISQIDYISVRENDAKIKLSELIEKPIEEVLDPTLLLKKEIWEENLSNTDKYNKKYIFAYVVAKDEEYNKIVNYLSEKTNLPVIHTELRNKKYRKTYKSIYTKNPFEFVNCIKNAEYVIATSFHATVFSIIFHKKFFIVPHKKTGARVLSLLNKLGIEGRTIQTLEQFKEVDYDMETDWKSVDKKLEEERKKSAEWLEKAIEG